jgi:hypothetical protein
VQSKIRRFKNSREMDLTMGSRFHISTSCAKEIAIVTNLCRSVAVVNLKIQVKFRIISIHDNALAKMLAL